MSKGDHKNVPDVLQEAAKLFEKKNKEYGDAYKKHPRLLFELLGPVHLETADDFEKFARVSGVLVKLNRFAKSFEEDTPHLDSAQDLVVFSAMLLELAEKENEQ